MKVKIQISIFYNSKVILVRTIAVCLSVELYRKA